MQLLLKLFVTIRTVMSFHCEIILNEKKNILSWT